METVFGSGDVQSLATSADSDASIGPRHHADPGPALFVAEPVLGERERAALAEVIASGWITMGPRVHAFERAFADRHGVADAVAVGSCTAALHLILAALGIGPGDEVLVPSLTFVATANSVVYVGATPIFVDIESPDLPLISLSDAASRCTPRTKAIVIMHYAGYLAEREAWVAFAAKRGLLLIEDAAHSLCVPGVGTYGDAAAFSFFGNKNMTTAEGGMVTARNPEVLDRIRQMRGHGLTSGTFQRKQSAVPHYDATMIGYNYRMDDLRAAIGLVQLEQIDDWNRRRRDLVRWYRERLAADCPRVAVPFADDAASAYHIMPVLLPAGADRDRVILALKDRRIHTTIHYPPAHRLSVYRSRDPGCRLPLTEQFADRELTLPLHPRMEGRDVDRVAAALTEALHE